ncbi:MAG: pyridoxamine 5'-phosphate oxidase family protein [Steroidobacteraceae bacterium]|nr:pyridoxamine 5'-phosphate oxidase family protein [Steroidobacteraceae bacterium]
MELEPQRTDELRHLGALIDSIGIGMLTTAAADGALRSRPLATLKMDAEPALWFLTSISSPKIDELDQSGLVGISYSDGESDFVSVTGASQIIRERDVIAELWTPLAKTWFPAGVDDPDLAALKVQIHCAEYWDGPDSKFIQLYAITKAVMTGEDEALGDHEKVRVCRKA